jgi:hypothetical protein
VSWLTSTVAFVYDFLADDGWELLAGLLIVLPLTYLVSTKSDLAGGVLLVAGVLASLSISLLRKLPKAG